MSKYKFFDIEDIPTPHFDIDDIPTPSTIDSEWLENECAFKDFSFELIVEYEHEQFELDFDTIIQQLNTPYFALVYKGVYKNKGTFLQVNIFRLVD